MSLITAMEYIYANAPLDVVLKYQAMMAIHIRETVGTSTSAICLRFMLELQSINAVQPEHLGGCTFKEMNNALFDFLSRDVLFDRFSDRKVLWTINQDMETITAGYAKQLDDAYVHQQKATEGNFDPEEFALATREWRKADQEYHSNMKFLIKHLVQQVTSQDILDSEVSARIDAFDLDVVEEIFRRVYRICITRDAP